MSTEISRRLLLASSLLFALPACDSKTKSKSKKHDDDDDDDDDDKKKKKKKKDDDDDEKPKAEKPIAVPGIEGFVVPVGGEYKHQRLELGDKVMEFDNYSYPLAKFPRDKLRADFKKDLEDAGWVVTNDSSSYSVAKGGVTVDVMFGEAGADDTKINIMGKR